MYMIVACMNLTNPLQEVGISQFKASGITTVTHNIDAVAWLLPAHTHTSLHPCMDDNIDSRSILVRSMSTHETLIWLIIVL